MGEFKAKREYLGENLDGQDFSGLCLVGVRFERCKIRRAVFAGADLSYTKFEECDLYESTFENAVLYFCVISNSDATKATFSGALLNGLRIKDTDITHVEFGGEFLAGVNRKWQSPPGDLRGFLIAPTGVAIPPFDEVEARYEGISNPDTNISIQFVGDADGQKWRAWRRRAEVAKTVEKALNENGYKDRSLDAYYLNRYYLTRAERRPLNRLGKIVFFELIWGYGVRVWRPLVSIIFSILIFSIIYSIVPLIDSASGLATTGGQVISPLDEGIDWSALGDVFVFSAQASSLSVYGDINPTGLAKWIGLLQTITSVVMIGLAVATITRRLSNV